MVNPALIDQVLVELGLRAAALVPPLADMVAVLEGFYDSLDIAFRVEVMPHAQRASATRARTTSCAVLPGPRPRWPCPRRTADAGPGSYGTRLGHASRR